MNSDGSGKGNDRLNQITNAEPVTLQARLCVSGNDLCQICGRRKERPIGAIETYLAAPMAVCRNDLDKWVCPDCGRRIDAELTDYAYHSNHQTPARTAGNSDGNYFGDCPECGKGGELLNIGPDHWFICAKHGLKWFIGSSLLSAWTHETEENWQRNAEFLERFREIDLEATHSAAEHYAPGAGPCQCAGCVNAALQAIEEAG